MKLKPKNTASKLRALVYKRFTNYILSDNLNNIYHNSYTGTYWVFDSSILDFIQITDLPNTPNLITIDTSGIYKYGNYGFIFSNVGTDAYGWQQFVVEPKSEFVFKNVQLYSSSVPLYRSLLYPIYVGVKSGTGSVSITNNSSEQISFALSYTSGGTNSTVTTDVDPNTTNNVIINAATDTLIKNVVVLSTTKTNADFSITINGYTLFAFTDVLTTLFPKIASIAKYQKNAYYYAGSFQFMIRGAVEGSTTQYIKGNIVPLTSMNIKYYDDSIDLQVDDLIVVDNKLYSVENQETDIKYQPRKYLVHFATLNSIL